MSGGKIAMVVIGAVLALVGFAALVAGGTLLWVNFTQRDAAGYYTTPTIRLDTSTYALTSDVDLGASTSEGNWVPIHVLGTVRIRAAAADGGPLFIGIGPERAVDRWLAGIPHAHVDDVSFHPFRVSLRPLGGGGTPSSPAGQGFWVASAAGPGTEVLHWPTRGGSWSAVIMNADASPGIRVDVSVGANTGILLPIGIGAAVFGVLVLAVAALLLALGARREKPPLVPPGSPAYYPPPGPRPPGPAGPRPPGVPAQS